MIAPAIILAPSDQTAICNWLVNASRGLRKRINSVEELDKAREAAKCALRSEKLYHESASVGASNLRRLHRIRIRAFELTKIAKHIGELESIGFLFEAGVVEHTVVRRREPKSSTVSIYPKQGEIA